MQDLGPHRPTPAAEPSAKKPLAQFYVRKTCSPSLKQKPTEKPRTVKAPPAQSFHRTLFHAADSAGSGSQHFLPARDVPRREAQAESRKWRSTWPKDSKISGASAFIQTAPQRNTSNNAACKNLPHRPAGATTQCRHGVAKGSANQLPCQATREAGPSWVCRSRLPSNSCRITTATESTHPTVNLTSLGRTHSPTQEA